MKKLILLLSAILLCFSISCGKQADAEETIDVNISIPEQVTVLTTDTSLSFTIMFGKAPLETDIFNLKESSGTSHECRITAITEKKVTIQLWSGMASGSYTVSLKRGSQVAALGVMTVTVDDPDNPVKPASGSTIYGQVTCGGEGVSGVVVSDGYLVVTTNSDGVYQLASDKTLGYVFISIPSGYEAERDGVFPTFWKAVSASTVTPQRADFVLNKVDNTNFTLYVLGDMHLAKRNNDLAMFRSIMSDWQTTISATTGPQYGLTMGDMTWDCYWYCNTFSIPQYKSEIQSDIKNIPIFHTMGNHDNDPKGVGDLGKELSYRETLCPTYYSYNLGKWHCIVLDNIDNTDVPACTFNGSGTIVDDYRSKYVVDFIQAEMEWLKKDLSYVDKSTPIIVSTHAPLYKPSSATAFAVNTTPHTSGSAGTAAFRTALSGYKVHMFTGHTHDSFGYEASSDYYETNSGAICGDWWWSGYLTSGLVISQDGTPGGYIVCKVNGTDMTWQYKASGKTADYQFRSYDMNKVKSMITYDLGGGQTGWKAYVDRVQQFGDNIVLINVWGYDSKWTVSVKEDGKDLTVTPVMSYDPLHLITYTAKRYTATASPSFPTSNWSHFFQVQASSASSTLEITVKDRFGNTYSETMERPKTFSVAAYK